MILSNTVAPDVELFLECTTEATRSCSLDLEERRRKRDVQSHKTQNYSSTRMRRRTLDDTGGY